MAAAMMSPILAFMNFNQKGFIVIQKNLYRSNKGQAKVRKVVLKTAWNV